TSSTDNDLDMSRRAGLVGSVHSLLPSITAKRTLFPLVHVRRLLVPRESDCHPGLNERVRSDFGKPPPGCYSITNEHPLRHGGGAGIWSAASRPHRPADLRYRAG